LSRFLPPGDPYGYSHRAHRTRQNSNRSLTAPALETPVFATPVFAMPAFAMGIPLLYPPRCGTYNRAAA